MKSKRTKLSGKKLSREDLDKLIAAADRARERVSKRNAISRSDAVSGYVAFAERLQAQFARRAEYYRTKQDDPYNMNMALYVAMLEARDSISDALKPHNGAICSVDEANE